MNWLPTYRRPMRSDHAPRCLLMLAAGLLALGLQLFAQVMPAQLMQGAMRASAARAGAPTLDEAQSFAATCLGFGMPAKGDPGKGDPRGEGGHATCPVCFTLAQTQGFAAPSITVTVAAVWTRVMPVRVAETAPARERWPHAFYSQAPPALAVL
ncbi:DUF2946 family protein [Dongia sp.]|uniref:DUF2946 family protein n=1 Tax=Dongia sp. TaxID=1977262 RepID=UPI0035B4CC52